MATVIDVFQKYQGEINWTEVVQAGVDMAYIKLTNGRNAASPPGDHYRDGCNQAGIMVGGYAYALGGDPLPQASAFASELQRLHIDAPGMGLAPMWDFEDPSLPIDPAERRGWIMAACGFLRKLLPTAWKQLLYSSANELNSIGGLSVPNVTLLSWDAEWGPNDGQVHPITAYHGTAGLHQYTSRGRIAGITGPVDVSQSLTDITEGQAPTPAPVPTQIPPGTYLRMGSTGPYVRILQEKLNTDYPLYSHLVVDGIFGVLTRNVVWQFQQRDHILVDGIAGPQTLHALGLQ